MSAQDLIRETASWLAERDAPTEVLADFGRTRGVLGIGKRPTLVPVARVWRLGVLLIAPDGRAWATGAITRKTDPKHSNYQSVSGEQRRDIRRLVWENAAFAYGESVDYDAIPLDLDVDVVKRGSGPLLEQDGIVTVEWAPGGRRLPLERYLVERRELLLPHDGWTG